MDWLKQISDISSRIDKVIDNFRGKAAKLLGIEDPIRILPYLGYGTAEKLLVKGRVLKDEGIKLREQETSIFENVWNMVRRFATDEVANARLKIRFGSIEQEIITDKEGFFNVEIYPAEDLSGHELWCPVDVSLIEPQSQGETVLDQAEVMIVGEAATFGVISDIDDTIMHTAATDVLKMIRIVYLGSPTSRQPFSGVAAFYQALQKGESGKGCNPIFYVSSSAWNMYDVFTQFMKINDVPKGPILLKDAELSLDSMVSFSHETHKFEQIEPIFERFPQLPFLLIGDSGQHDPEIYSQLAQKFPGRILGILIRNVTVQDSERLQELQEIAAKVHADGSQFLLFQETHEATAYAAAQGWIAAIDSGNILLEQRA